MGVSIVEDILVSIVIPCFNEEENIKETLRAIYISFSGSVVPFEVVVVDNLSVDNSVDIAEAHGARIVSSRAKTVAGVRNEGVGAAQGNIFIFLDADIVLSNDWYEEFYQLINLILDQRIIVGAHCIVPSHISGILLEWYLQIQKDNRDTHLGSGHMVVSRKFFEELNGFNSELVSGEDYDLCERAKLIGGRLVVEPKLKAIHSGYPIDLIGFVRRECWHGLGDVTSFDKIGKSKTALSALLFLGFHLIFFVSVISGSIFYAALCAINFFVFLISVIIYKFGFSYSKKMINLIPALYLYLAGRLFSFFKVWVSKGE